MKLIIFGATGGIGSQVIQQALAAGHDVTAVARRPAAIALQHEHLTVTQGDVLQADMLRETIAGKDAIISALGARDRAPTTIYSEGIANIIGAMQASDVRRILCISAGGLDPVVTWQRVIAKPILWLVFKNMYTDLVRMETTVKASDLDWTIIRPPALTNGPRTGKYHSITNNHLPHNFAISRADVADYLIGHLTEPSIFATTVAL